MRPPLVLLHGWGVNAEIWNQILPDLESEFDLTVIDLPGYGIDTEYADEYSLDSIVETVLSRAPMRANWVGWSLGGTIALEAARLFPDRFDGLQLVSSTPRFVTDAQWPHGSVPEVLQTFENDFAENFEKALAKFLSLQTFTNDRTESRKNLKLARNLTREQLQHKQPSQRTLLQGLNILAETDLRDRLSEINVPIQIVCGSDDQVVPPSASRHLFKYLPNCHSFHELACSHLPFLQNSSEYIEALNSFVHA